MTNDRNLQLATILFLADHAVNAKRFDRPVASGSSSDGGSFAVFECVQETIHMANTNDIHNVSRLKHQQHKHQPMSSAVFFAGTPPRQISVTPVAAMRMNKR